MSGIRVQTGYLRGYATQIEGNSSGPVGEIEQYCRTHCKNFSGIEGVMYPARLALDLAADRVLDLAGEAKRGLMFTAQDLHSTAALYDKADYESAEQIWDTGSAPKRYRETDAEWSYESPFTSGATIVLITPEDYREAKEAKDAVYQLLGTINDLVARFTGYDLLEKALPVVFGDWGALHRIGDSWEQMETGFSGVSADMSEGLSKLSEHWDSSVSGAIGASREFDYHIRREWLPALQAVAQLCDTLQQGCEYMAKFYEDAVRDLLFLLNFYTKRIKKAFDGVLNFALLNWKKFLWNLWQLVSSLWQMLVDLVKMITVEIEKWRRLVEAAAAAIVTLRNYFRGDFGQVSSW